jgi:hypothetical protein
VTGQTYNQSEKTIHESQENDSPRAPRWNWSVDWALVDGLSFSKKAKRNDGVYVSALIVLSAMGTSMSMMCYRKRARKDSDRYRGRT